MHGYGETQGIEAVKSSGSLGPCRLTLRQQLLERQTTLQGALNDVNGALTMLEAHPDLEQFQEAIAKVGCL